MSLRQFIIRQKYRFDMGAGPLSMATFAIVASDKIQMALGITQTRYSLIIGFVLGGAGVWMVGRILDHFRYMQYYNREANARNEDLQEIKKQTEKS